MGKRIRLLTLIWLLIIALAACLAHNTVPETSDEEFSATTTIEPDQLNGREASTSSTTIPGEGSITAVTPSDEELPVLETVEDGSSLYFVSDIPIGYIHHLKWASDSQAIFFKVNNEAWVHELVNQGSKQSNLDELLTGTPSIPESLPETVSSGSTNLELASVAPSGQKAVLLGADTTITHTPLPITPSVSGELPIDSYFAEIWIWTAGDFTQLSAVQVCGENEYIWSEDEMYVAIQTKCLFPEIWIIDVEGKKLSPVLPLEEYGGFVDLHSYVPNEKKLLVSYIGADSDGQFTWLYTVELSTLKAVKLDTPRFIWPIAWYSSNQLVVLYSHKFGIEGIKRPAIFDLATSTLANLLDPERDDLSDELDVQWIELSPNKKYLAFTTVEEPYIRSTLWLLALDN